MPSPTEPKFPIEGLSMLLGNQHQAKNNQPTGSQLCSQLSSVQEFGNSQSQPPPGPCIPDPAFLPPLCNWIPRDQETPASASHNLRFISPPPEWCLAKSPHLKAEEIQGDAVEHSLSFASPAALPHPKGGTEQGPTVGFRAINNMRLFYNKIAAIINRNS